LDDFPSVVLASIERFVPSDLASYNEVDPVAGRAVVYGRPRQPSPEEVRVWESLAHENPVLMYVLRTGDGSARRMSEFLPTEEFHRLDLYKQVFSPLAVEHQVAFSLPAPAPLVIGIALNRVQSDFTDDEVAYLNLLRPHLVQAYRRLQLLRDQRHALNSLADLLEDQGRAFHVVGQKLTGSVLRLMSDYIAASGDASGSLPEAVRVWLEEERSVAIGPHSVRLRQPLVYRRKNHSLTIQLIPGGHGPDLLWLHERRSETDGRVLERLGLSAREAEVLWRLSRGDSSKAIAQQLRISPATVKKHLEHIYRKLGVTSRTAAVAHALDALTIADSTAIEQAIGRSIPVSP
jgi:DNA-binding CsgD family transcriptional regulator